MPETTPRQPRRARTATVVRVEQLTPQMIRVVLGGEGLAGLGVGEFTDHYVKLLFPPAGADYGHPCDPSDIEATRPREQWPVTRAYTVRRWDADAHELTLDFVYHGDEGVAGPWAAAAKPGDEISFFGPGGAYAPAPSADWHLFVGDESALPAIAASVERIAPGVPAYAVIEVEDADERQALDCPGELRVVWLHRADDGGSAVGSAVSAAVLAAVRELPLPEGDGHAFVHGDAGLVRDVRRYLRVEVGMPREAMSVSGYWRRGRTDEAWRAEKREWNQQVELDDAERIRETA